MEPMADPTSPAIDVDQVMRGIREKVALLRAGGGAGFAEARQRFAGWARMEELIAAARRLADVGQELPAMTRTKGLKRLVAAPLAWGVLRVAQIVTRDQRAYNHAAADGLAHLHERMTGELLSLRDELEAVRAELLEVQRRLAATRSINSP